MPPTININDERYKRLRFHMRRLRLAADLTQVQLAQRLHVDPVSYTHLTLPTNGW